MNRGTGSYKGSRSRKKSGPKESKLRMPSLSFKTDWVDADGIRGPELASTWAALEIRVDDSIVTRVLDTRAQTVRNFVYVPLYPFAEWVATNWWFLTHEISSPAKEGDPGFRRRHAIGGDREGYAFPELRMFPHGGLTRLAWEPDRPPWTSIEFLGGGEAWVDSDEFRAACADLIDLVIRRLRSLGVEGTLLQEEWSAIQGADTDEIEFCRTAARLGWDPYAMDDNERSLVLALAGELGGAALEEATAVFSAQNLMMECSAVTGALGRAKANGLRWKRLGSIDREMLFAEPVRAPTPWAAGYRLAQELRRDLDLDGTPLPSMARIAEAIGEEPALLTNVTAPVDFREVGLIDGVITADDDRNPAFAFREFSGEETNASTSAAPLRKRWYLPARKRFSPERIPSASSATAPSRPSSWHRRPACNRECPGRWWTATTSTNWLPCSAFRRG